MKIIETNNTAENRRIALTEGLELTVGFSAGIAAYYSAAAACSVPVYGQLACGVAVGVITVVAGVTGGAFGNYTGRMINGFLSK